MEETFLALDGHQVVVLFVQRLRGAQILVRVFVVVVENEIISKIKKKKVKEKNYNLCLLRSATEEREIRLDCVQA